MIFDGLCKKKEYTVKLKPADINVEYNIPEKKGYVYNFLEDAEISVEGMKYIVTGIKGEQWPVPEAAASRYEIIEEVEDGVLIAKTKPDDTVYEYKLIPADTTIQITISNGSVLNVNSEKSDHGDGDRLIRIKGEEDFWVVNGLIFSDTYEIID